MVNVGINRRNSATSLLENSASSSARADFPGTNKVEARVAAVHPKSRLDNSEEDLEIVEGRGDPSVQAEEILKDVTQSNNGNRI